MCIQNIIGFSMAIICLLGVLSWVIYSIYEASDSNIEFLINSTSLVGSIAFIVLVLYLVNYNC